MDIETQVYNFNLAKGLTTKEVDEQIAKGNQNISKLKSSRTFFSILRENIFTLFNFILISLSVIMFLVSGLSDALFGSIIIVNTIIGIVVEVKSKLVLDRLSILGQNKVKVIRDGENKVVLPKELVVGDIVVLSQGDQIVVDGSVISSISLAMDESNLTGESDSVSKVSGDQILSGSFVASGQGIMKVEVVGDNVYASKISTFTKKYENNLSELQIGINKILKIVSIFILPFSLLIMFSQSISLGGIEKVLTSSLWIEAIKSSTAAIESMIPQGLVLLTSLNFAIAIILLSKKNVLIQEMQSVETLARVGTICLDKTGTLTTGNINVEKIIFDDSKDLDTIKALYTLTCLPGSNASACAISKFLDEKYPNLKKKYNSLYYSISPFDSKVKRSTITIKGTEYILGAPEIILDKINDEILELIEDGSRVLVFCESKKIKATIVLSEEIRGSAKKTLEYFKQQNVRPIIISGDNEKTVSNIASKVGIDVKSYDCQNLPQNIGEVQKIVMDFNVFTRVTPEQKLLLIKALKEEGEIVAMTGDGVNDAMAIKEANLGIAMNNASSITKNISQIVLLDSNFSSLPSVVGQGRRIMANMERVASLFLNKTFYSITLGILVTVFMTNYPYLPRHMTIISALTIGIPSFLLAIPKNNTPYKKGFLKRVLGFSIKTGVSIGLLLFGSTLIFSNILHLQKNVSHTYISLILFALSFVILVIVCRPLKGWKIGMLIGIIIVLAFIYLFPVSQEFFKLVFF